jgi:RimJ/RimL family protein N-acetyltransferase
MKSSFLIGNKVYLRPLTLEDVSESYVGWFNDSEVCRYNSHHRFPMTVDDVLTYIQSVAKSKQSLVLAIIDIATEKHIGNIALQSIDWVARSAELAIVIGDKNYWGKGIGREACVLLVRHGLHVLNLHRIWLGTMEQNVGMQKIAESLGFIREGVLRQANCQGETFSDGYAYGLLSSEFIA